MARPMLVVSPGDPGLQSEIDGSYIGRCENPNPLSARGPKALNSPNCENPTP